MHELCKERYFNLFGAANCIAIQKQILLVGVRVHVDEEGDAPARIPLQHQLLGRVNGRMNGRLRVRVVPIQIAAPRVAAVVAACDAVGIQTRNQFEDEAIAQQDGARVVCG